MKKGKSKKQKGNPRTQPRHVTAGWGAFFVLAAAFGVAAWFALRRLMSEDADFMAKFGLVLVFAVLCSALATYLLNSILAAWARRRRRRS